LLVDDALYVLCIFYWLIDCYLYNFYILYYSYPNLLFLNSINIFYDFNYPTNFINTLRHMDNLIISTSDFANSWCIHFSMKIVQNIWQIDSNSHLLKMCILNHKTWQHLLCIEKNTLTILIWRYRLTNFWQLDPLWLDIHT